MKQSRLLGSSSAKLLSLDASVLFPVQRSEAQTIATSAHVWLDRATSQLRFEIQQEHCGRRFLCVSSWTEIWDGWHPEHGIRISSWRELFAVITALCRSWLAVYFTKADRGG